MSLTIPQSQIDEQAERLQRLWKARKKAAIAAGALNSALREYDVNYKQVDAISELVSTVLQYQWMSTVSDLRHNLGQDATQQITGMLKD